MSLPHQRKPDSEIERAGGAYVRRRIDLGGRNLGPGDTLTAEEVRAIPRANLDALVNTGRIELWPAAPHAAANSERFAVHLGFGKYNVVEGVRLTAEPVSKEEAEALTGAA